MHMRREKHFLEILTAGVAANSEVSLRSFSAGLWTGCFEHTINSVWLKLPNIPVWYVLVLFTFSGGETEALGDWGVAEIFRRVSGGTAWIPSETRCFQSLRSLPRALWRPSSWRLCALGLITVLTGFFLSCLWSSSKQSHCEQNTAAWCVPVESVGSGDYFSVRRCVYRAGSL